MKKKIGDITSDDLTLLYKSLPKCKFCGERAINIVYGQDGEIIYYVCIDECHEQAVQDDNASYIDTISILYFINDGKIMGIHEKIDAV